jgi:hypothetical protein
MNREQQGDSSKYDYSAGGNTEMPDKLVEWFKW